MSRSRFISNDKKKNNTFFVNFILVAVVVIVVVVDVVVVVIVARLLVLPQVRYLFTNELTKLLHVRTRSYANPREEE